MFDRQRILAIARGVISSGRREYVVFADYDDEFRDKICKEGTLPPTKAGFYLWEIKKILLDPSNDLRDRYRYERHKEARFYPLYPP